jgi:Type VI secretion system (T6SS), amidase effector protein 4
MRLSFSRLRQNYSNRIDVDRAALFHEIGWDDVIDNGNFYNTCAIRVSLAIIKSNAQIPGRIAIKRGSHKGSLIEPGQAKLSRILARPSMLGAPEIYKGGQQANKAIGTRQGIVSFWRVRPDIGDMVGHIDIVSPYDGGMLRCGSDCYWQAAEVWFWPIK